MIDFSLTDEQQALREMAHDFAAREMRPVAREYDRDGTWPAEVIEKAWEVGLMNPHIPDEYGGAGASYMDGVLIEEELGEPRPRPARRLLRDPHARDARRRGGPPLLAIRLVPVG